MSRRQFPIVSFQKLFLPPPPPLLTSEPWHEMEEKAINPLTDLTTLLLRPSLELQSKHLIAIALSFLKWVFAQLDEPAVGGRQSFHGLRSELRFFAQSAGQNYLLHLSRIKIMDVICSPKLLDRTRQFNHKVTASYQRDLNKWSSSWPISAILQACAALHNASIDLKTHPGYQRFFHGVKCWVY